MDIINKKIGRSRNYHYEKCEIDGETGKLYGVNKLYTGFDVSARKNHIPCKYEDIKSVIIRNGNKYIGEADILGFIITKIFDGKKYMGLLTEDGREILPCNKGEHEYAYVGVGNTYYSNCLDIAKYDKSWKLNYGLVTINQNNIFSPHFSIPCEYSNLTFNKKIEEIEATKKVNGKTLRGNIDYEGKIVKPFRVVKNISKSDIQFFEYATDFNNYIGIALVKNENGYFYINTFGERISDYYPLAFIPYCDYFKGYARAYKSPLEDDLLLYYDKKIGKMNEINLSELPETTPEELNTKREILTIAKENTYIVNEISSISEVQKKLGELRNNGKLIEKGYENEWVQEGVSNPKFKDSFINDYRIAGRITLRDAKYSSDNSINGFFYQDCYGEFQKQLGYWNTITPFNSFGYAIVSIINKERKQEFYIIDENGNAYSTPVKQHQLTLDFQDYLSNVSVTRPLEFYIENGIITMEHQSEPNIYDCIVHLNGKQYNHFGYKVISTKNGFCYQNIDGEYILKPDVLSKDETQKKLKKDFNIIK